MIGAVVLAAGASTRYGRPKQWELLPAVLERLSQCRLDCIVVVEGAYPFGHEPGSAKTAEPGSGAYPFAHEPGSAKTAEPGSGAYPLGPYEPGSRSEPGSRLSVVHCADWERGPGASLRCGLGALGDDVTHAVVVLADGPELDPRAVARVLEHRDASEVVAASYDGARNHPVVLARSVWAGIPDEGARALDPLLVDCSDLEPPGDVDVPRAAF